MGIANPIPTEPPVLEKMLLLTPTTSPTAFTSGPPELPGLMEASVWIIPTYTPAWSWDGSRLRPTALTTPAVTDGSALPSRYAYGLPIATTHSPIIRFSLEPMGTVGSPVASTFSTAMSVWGSSPSTRAG